jgi:predicted  nucleic acid-binding Zn-ribbon protein
MTDQFDVLKRLQAIDSELFRLRREQADKPQVVDEVARRVAAQEARLHTAEGRLRQLQVAQKEQEVELATREAQVKKLQGQLFQLKTNKEYAAMQREIETLKADNSLREDAILKLFEAIDRATRERQEEQRRLTEEQQHQRREQQRIEQELAAIAERVAELERRHQEVAPHVPPEALATYEQVLTLRDGLALAPVVNEICGGCNRRLPPQVISSVYLKAALVMCEHCNRILYVDETPSTL